MKSTMIFLSVLAAFSAAPVQAGPFDDRLDAMAAEILALRQEVTTLKSLLARDATGNLAFTATGSRTDRVGLNALTTIGANTSLSAGGDSTATIGKSSATQIGLSRSVTVARDDLLKVGGSSTANIAVNSTVNVGGTATQQVNGNSLSTVNGSSTDNIRVNSNVTVGGTATRRVAGSSSDAVNGNVSHQVGGSMGIAVARAMTIDAGDQLTLKSGYSTIILKKNGEITINGTSIRVTGSAEVVFKAPKVLTN